MRFENVCIESIAHALPERSVRSEEIEARLAPIYERLRLVPGRLELMSGIRERRFWNAGTRPSDGAARAGRAALAQTTFDRARVGCLIHAAVSRDFMEPATASIVHARLELSERCTAFDLSNACLGFANAMTVVASMIERGEIEAGLVVAAEDGEPLVEATLASLLAMRTGDDRELKAALKRAYASLTIGSGAAAMLLVHRSLASVGHRLLGGRTLAATQHHELCRGDRSAGHTGPLMQTDSEALLRAGNALASDTWRAFQSELGWSARDVQRVVTHQVGSAHRRALFDTLGLELAIDFPTLETHGNVGSVSLPLSLSMAADHGFIRGGHRVALLGIGSGLHCSMLGLEW